MEGARPREADPSNRMQCTDDEAPRMEEERRQRNARYLSTPAPGIFREEFLQALEAPRQFAWEPTDPPGTCQHVDEWWRVNIPLLIPALKAQNSQDPDRRALRPPPRARADGESGHAGRGPRLAGVKGDAAFLQDLREGRMG